LEVDLVAEDGDVVKGGKQGDKAEHEAADGLKGSKPVNPESPESLR
jgi:hypothetical protein